MTGARFTFRANRNRGRHGWLRLTPAYSVGLVEELVQGLTSGDFVIDPFCGTGTTALTCAERGIPCDSFDINPFLVWLATAKIAAYDTRDTEQAQSVIESMSGEQGQAVAGFSPPMANIERWWDRDAIEALGRARNVIASAVVTEAARDLMWVAFSRTVIETSKASFRHQSVSLKHDISYKHNNPAPISHHAVHQRLKEHLNSVIQATTSVAVAPVARIRLGDARNVGDLATDHRYTSVITSPPYPNRMSYVRELRPYMYWLGYLETAAEAGDLDWLAIGGTWGRATSNLVRWSPEPDLPIVAEIVKDTVSAISNHSAILGTYVHKYVHDAALHVHSLTRVLAPGARLTYVVGNSRFYDVMVHTERIYAALFAWVGMEGISIEQLRKRTSKRELFEFAVHARVPDEAQATPKT